MSTVTELDRPAALDRRAFEAALVEAIAPYKAEDSRFYRLVANRRCPQSMMLRYAQATHRSAEMFCESLSQMIDQAPDACARLVLLENLMEEEGIELTPGRGLVVRPQRRHSEIAMRFVRACGGDADPGAVHATSPGLKMLAEGRWTEGATYLLVGQELKFAEASQTMLRLLREFGFSDYDLAFFAIHGSADLEHGRQAIALVLDHARTRDEQERCIAAAGASARHWFEMHGGRAKD